MNSHRPDIDRLISLYLSQRATENERQELEQWLGASSANRQVFESIRKVWSLPSHYKSSSDTAQVRDQIWKAGTGQQQSAPTPLVHGIGNVLYWSKVAAVFFMFLLGAGLFSLLVKENVSSLLTAPVALVEIENPAGQRSAYTLPDGTAVWLNAESSLVYPEKFSDTLRVVQLQGEGFFQVTKDLRRPFIVRAAGTSTEALGTAFNINAYSEDDIVKIALLEGKARVQSADRLHTAVLSPGEELLAPKNRSGFSTRQFNYENTFGWKEDILIFDGADFTKFRNTIEKWYGVKVETQGTLPVNWQIRARYQHEELRNVLRDIGFNKNIKFELHDKKVLITF